MVKESDSSSPGKGGYSLLSIPSKLNVEPLVEILTFVPSLVSTSTSISANSRTILDNSLTGKVTVPSFSTSAFTQQLIPRSKLVVVKKTESLEACNKTF